MLTQTYRTIIKQGRNPGVLNLWILKRGTDLAILRGETTIFYVIYFFWWNELIVTNAEANYYFQVERPVLDFLPKLLMLFPINLPVIHRNDYYSSRLDNRKMESKNS